MTTSRRTETRNSKSIIAAGRVGCGCQSRPFFWRDWVYGRGSNPRRDAGVGVIITKGRCEMSVVFAVSVIVGVLVTILCKVIESK